MFIEGRKPPLLPGVAEQTARVGPCGTHCRTAGALLGRRMAHVLAAHTEYFYVQTQRTAAYDAFQPSDIDHFFDDLLSSSTGANFDILLSCSPNFMNRKGTGSMIAAIAPNNEQAGPTPI
jgi:hypothetical protein